MANYVSKDEVKKFVRDVRIEMDARYAAKFAPAAELANVKKELADLKDGVSPLLAEAALGKVLSANDFTNDEKTFLAELTNATSAGFDASDVVEIFSD